MKRIGEALADLLNEAFRPVGEEVPPSQWRWPQCRSRRRAGRTASEEEQPIKESAGEGNLPGDLIENPERFSHRLGVWDGKGGEKMTALELAKKVAALLDAKKAKDVEAIDIHGLTTIGDYFVVASGSSTSQTKALADEVEEKLSQLGVEPKRVEG